MKTPHPVVAGCQARLHARALRRARRVRKTPVRMLRRWMFRNAAGWRAKIERLEDRLWAERDLHAATKLEAKRIIGHRDRLAAHLEFVHDLHDAQVDRLGRTTGYALGGAMAAGIGFLIMLTYLLSRCL